MVLIAYAATTLIMPTEQFSTLAIPRAPSDLLALCPQARHRCRSSTGPRRGRVRSRRRHPGHTGPARSPVRHANRHEPPRRSPATRGSWRGWPSIHAWDIMCGATKSTLPLRHQARARRHCGNVAGCRSRPLARAVPHGASRCLPIVCTAKRWPLEGPAPAVGPVDTSPSAAGRAGRDRRSSRLVRVARVTGVLGGAGHDRRALTGALLSRASSAEPEFGR